MKKIFTLIAASLLTVASFAADRRPSVTLKTAKNYEIVIDGQSYFSTSNNGTMNISNIRSGQHSIKVFEANRTFMFRKAKRMVSASTFQLGRNDVAISIDFRGQINITEDRFGHGMSNGSRDNGWDKGYGQDNSRDNGQDKGYGNGQKDSHDQGQGHDNNQNDRGKRF